VSQLSQLLPVLATLAAQLGQSAQQPRRESSENSANESWDSVRPPIEVGESREQEVGAETTSELVEPPIVERESAEWLDEASYPPPPPAGEWLGFDDRQASQPAEEVT
jgi:hypothetical protein